MIKLKSASDINLLNKFTSDNRVLIIYEDKENLWYTLSCTSNSTGNALELANKAYECGQFAATDIEFVDDIHFASAPSYNDAKYTNQWNLTGEYGINLNNTHSITTGSEEITVAVIDNGFILNHPDMPLDASLSWDANSQTTPAKQYYYDGATANNHGIGVAGIIGANINNNIGIAGIAPGVKIMAISVRIEMTDTTDLTALTALRNAVEYAYDSGADVINNSWTTNIKHQSLNEVIENALTSGRNEKGCVVIFATGNDGLNISKMPYSENSDVISVGATIPDGFRWTGSNYSEHLDIVAPGSYIPTLSENPLYRNPEGTSFAAPHVAAVASLILSVNPQLSSNQVTEILSRTATKLPEYTFSMSGSYGSWDEEVGYGIVNCYDAVTLAQNYFNPDSYYNLIEFDYTGTNIFFKLNTTKDLTVIWDENGQEYSFIPAGSSDSIGHVYSGTGSKHIIIAEYSPDASTMTSSSAITEFDFITGSYASDINIKPCNNALEYVRITGGPGFTAQNVNISDLRDLKELFLVGLKNSNISITDCPALRTFGTSTQVWIPSTTGSMPMNPLDNGNTLDPNVVGGENVGKPTDDWPYIPEKVISPLSLSISGCSNITTLSLENVGFGPFSFTEMPNLHYVYLSSQLTRIVGAGGNASNPNYSGLYLSSAVSTLPQRQTSLSRGKIVVRAVNSTNTAYIPVTIATTHKNNIQNTCSSKNWDLVWDSGIN